MADQAAQQHVGTLTNHGSLRNYCKANNLRPAKGVFTSDNGNPILILQPADGSENVRVVLSKRAGDIIAPSGMIQSDLDNLFVQERDDKGLIVTTNSMELMDL
jgi:hypothetical protein